MVSCDILGAALALDVGPDLKLSGKSNLITRLQDLTSRPSSTTLVDTRVLVGCWGDLKLASVVCRFLLSSLFSWIFLCLITVWMCCTGPLVIHVHQEAGPGYPDLALALDTGLPHPVAQTRGVTLSQQPLCEAATDSLTWLNFLKILFRKLI